MFDALRRLGRTVECLMFDDDGHQIVKRENREALVRAIKGWLTSRIRADANSVTNPVADRMFGENCPPGNTLLRQLVLDTDGGAACAEFSA